MYGDIKMLIQKSFLFFLKEIEYSESLVISLIWFMHTNVHKMETLPKTSLEHVSDLTF